MILFQSLAIIFFSGLAFGLDLDNLNTNLNLKFSSLNFSNFILSVKASKCSQIHKPVENDNHLDINLLFKTQFRTKAGTTTAKVLFYCCAGSLNKQSLFQINWCGKNNISIFRQSVSDSEILTKPANPGDIPGFVSYLYQRPLNNVLSKEPLANDLVNGLKGAIQLHLNKSVIFDSEKFTDENFKNIIKNDGKRYFLTRREFDYLTNVLDTNSDWIWLGLKKHPLWNGLLPGPVLSINGIKH